MKKILLFGTMLGVATTALAFGGIFNHGNKSTTYKGGVSAIGVHFGGETSDNTKECSGNGVKGVDDNCYCHQGYTGTNCENKLCESGSFCGMDGDEPLCCPSDHICTTAGNVLGTCWRAESGCTTNADCESGKFCNLGVMDAWEPTGGTCEPLDEGTLSKEVKDDNGNIVFAAGQFLASSSYMNWWSARNWCEAQNKRMVHLSSFKIASPLIDGCMLPCLSNENCSYQVYYDGTPDSEMICTFLGGNALDENSGSKLYRYIPQALTGYYYWTDDGSDEINMFNIDGVSPEDFGGGEENAQPLETPLGALCE